MVRYAAAAVALVCVMLLTGWAVTPKEVVAYPEPHPLCLEIE